MKHFLHFFSSPKIIKNLKKHCLDMFTRSMYHIIILFYKLMFFSFLISASKDRHLCKCIYIARYYLILKNSRFLFYFLFFFYSHRFTFYFAPLLHSWNKTKDYNLLKCIRVCVYVSMLVWNQNNFVHIRIHCRYISCVFVFGTVSYTFLLCTLWNVCILL